jgi:hypothetical protein
VPKKRRPCAETISNRFVHRKNFKDQLDAETQKLKLEILQIEKEVKLKRLQVVQQQLDNEQKLFDINFQNRLEEISYERKVCQIKINKLYSKNFLINNCQCQN